MYLLILMLHMKHSVILQNLHPTMYLLIRLLYAVTKAEKELGGGTGQIKLRYVYDMFVARFAWLARVISFEAFSMMVDEALERMKKMLESNKAMQTLVSGEAGEVNE